jgi:hypothetical protein
MSEITQKAVHDIRIPMGIESEGAQTQITFQGGLTATLPSEHPDHDFLCRVVERSLERQRPVGFILDPEGRIIALSHTYDTNVRRVEDDEDGRGLVIGFWSYCTVSYLTWDHPDFERIRKTLTEAIATGTSVLVANHTWPIVGETEIWNKILDVRPLPVPEPAGQANGTAATTAPVVPQAAMNVKP